MDLRRIFRKVPKALDTGGGDDASPLGDAIAANEGSAPAGGGMTL